MKDTVSFHGFSEHLGLAAIAAFVTFVEHLFGAEVFEPAAREAAYVPWPVCFVTAVALFVLLPWVVSLPLLRNPRLRLYFLICLAGATVFWVFGSSHDLWPYGLRL